MIRTLLVTTLLLVQWKTVLAWFQAQDLTAYSSLFHRYQSGPSTRIFRSWMAGPYVESDRSTSNNDETGLALSEIIGNGRIGNLLAQAGSCSVLGRNDSIDPNGTGPILVATRNDALEAIVDKCPSNRRADLVFLQNGYLDGFLQSKQLSDNTQVLLYLSVTARGVPAVDGITKRNPEGLTTATGRHAQAFADRLAKLQLKCNVVTPDAYRPAMFEKLMYGITG